MLFCVICIYFYLLPIFSDEMYYPFRKRSCRTNIYTCHAGGACALVHLHIESCGNHCIRSPVYESYVALPCYFFASPYASAAKYAFVGVIFYYRARIVNKDGFACVLVSARLDSKFPYKLLKLATEHRIRNSL